MNFPDLGMVIVAGGGSRRYGSGNKLLENLDGIPLFLHSVRQFSPCCAAGGLVLVTPEAEQECFADWLRRDLPGRAVKLVTGGAVRSESVRNGLNALPPGLSLVAVHDAARPLATPALLARCVEAARRCGGAVPGRPVVDTLKAVDESGHVVETVDRGRLRRVETPQVFQFELLREAWRRAGEAGMEFTDDAAVMEFAGFPVEVVTHASDNLKITYPEDLAYLRWRFQSDQ